MKQDARYKRWQQAAEKAVDAVKDARAAEEQLQKFAARAEDAFRELLELQGEYDHTLVRMADNLKDSRDGSMLLDIIGIDIEGAVDAVASEAEYNLEFAEAIAVEAKNADLPFRWETGATTP